MNHDPMAPPDASMICGTAARRCGQAREGGSAAPPGLARSPCSSRVAARGASETRPPAPKVRALMPILSLPRAFGRPLKLIVIALALALLPAVRPASAAGATDAAVDALLAEARAEATQGCGAPSDRLVAILCRGRITVGVRGDYPVFGFGPAEAPRGFEPDIARAIAARLGVSVGFRRVNAASRVAALGEDGADLIIATMGHTTQRDGEVRFIRPHYFQSRTVLVGLHPLNVATWHDIVGSTVCVTVGNVINASLTGHGARLMLFDAPGDLVNALQLGTCNLAAQDDSFFASAFADPDFAARFAVKLSLAPLPWGMAVPREGADRLATLLELLSVQFHRDGVYLGLAARNGVPLDFLHAQQAAWRSAACLRADGGPASGCLIDPVDSALPPTPFAGRVQAFEDWLEARLGVPVSFPMLKTAPAWTVFLNGLVNSIVLVSGALAATFAMTLAIAAALTAPSRLLRLPVRLLTLLGQSSPIVLMMFFGYVLASAVMVYSVPVAMLVAVLVIGLYNAAYAGPAVAEAARALEQRTGARASLPVAVRQASAQVLAFMVNAARGSSIASVIGVPELLELAHRHRLVLQRAGDHLHRAPAVLFRRGRPGGLGRRGGAPPARAPSGSRPTMLTGGFVPAFLSGLLLNMSIAIAALLLGLALGAPLALLRLGGRWPGRLAGLLTALMRLAPAFVVMFFLLNLLPAAAPLGPWTIPLHGPVVVVLSLLAYAAAYVSDTGLEAMLHRRAGSHELALLFLPALARAFFVLVMSSSTGAAIGVNEAVTVTLRQAQSLPDVHDRLLLFGAVVLFFTCLLQGGFLVVDRLRHRLVAVSARPARATAPSPGTKSRG